MNLFERYLTLWVFLCIIAGVVLGQFFPAPFQYLGSLQVAQVNLPGFADLGDDYYDAAAH